jgi:hypothetical protein
LPALVPLINKTLLKLARAKGLALFVLAIVVSGQKASAIELMSSADTMESKSWAITAYGAHEKSEPQVENGATDLEFDAENDLTGLILTVRPGDYLQYRFLYGILRNYELEVGSGSFVNRHESQSDGHQYGFGVRMSASPQTIVSLGTALDLSYVHRDVDFEKLESNGVVSALDEGFRQDEVQLAANVSKRWKRLEPYGGIKFAYVTTKIVDRATLSKMRGHDEAISPFVGLKLEFFEKESLIVEASFADEESFSAGLNIKF